MTVHILSGTGYDSNCFLISGDRAILVDTGTGIHHSTLLASISKVEDISRVRKIILTHCHYDHVGGAQQMAKALDAEVHIHELDAPPVREGSSTVTTAEMFGSRMDPMNVKCLNSGDLLDTGDHVFTVIHTPGHTRGGICLFEASTGSLISGDTVFAGGVGRWDLPTGDLNSLIISVKRLASLRLTDLYPGHGPCVRGNADEYMKEALNYLGE
ncbi:MAG: MBL fold metallo-hydrolase [Euryarchaeota archaeon]|nr:MBL fold metallo-hydrolase [Euryarchaeota archaeon]